MSPQVVHVAEPLAAMAAGEGGGGVDGLGVGSQVIFVLEAFVTHCARKGLGRGGVGSVDVGGQVRLLCKALTTSCMWAGEGRGISGVNGGHVPG